MSIGSLAQLLASGPPFFYLPSGWNQGWNTAKGRIASGGKGTIAFLGDSISNGSGADGNPAHSPLRSLAYPGLIRASLAAKYPVFADFYSGAYNDLLTCTVSITYAGGFGYGTYCSFATSGIASFVSPYACTDLDFIVGASGAQFNYNIDGGSATPVTPPNHSDQWPFVITFRGLANAIHTVGAASQASALACSIWGLTSYPNGPNANGLGYVFQAHSGDQSSVFVPGSPPPNIGPPHIWGGWTSAGAATGFGFPSAPDLTIIEIGINDMQLGGGDATHAATMAQNIGYLISGIRRGNANASIILLVISCPLPSSDLTSGNFTNFASWPMFKAQYYSLAQEYGCGLLDIDAAWGQTPVTQGFTNATVLAHPLAAGHTDIANRLLTIL